MKLTLYDMSSLKSTEFSRGEAVRTREIKNEEKTHFYDIVNKWEIDEICLRKYLNAHPPL